MMMGFAISWCAVREEGADQFLRELGLSSTGETEEIPESLISTAKLDTGWSIVWYNKYGCPFLKQADLSRLSMNHDVLLCLVEEHVMASSAELWSSGKQKWRLSHEGENGSKGLSVQGSVPDVFPAIRKETEEMQLAEGGDDATVDYIFEIPLKVAQSLVGFKHDEETQHLIGGIFHVASQSAPKSGFLSRLLKR